VHRQLCEQLLREEVNFANTRPVRARLAGDVQIEDLAVLVDVTQQGRTYRLALSGDNYNAEPLSLSVRDIANGATLGQEGWPPSLSGGIHPVTNAPFCCIRGVAEYYIHPSHLQERWDQHRRALRVDVLVGHILDKMGAPR
jgi:hypothetical protein